MKKVPYPCNINPRSTLPISFSEKSKSGNPVQLQRMSEDGQAKEPCQHLPSDSSIKVYSCYLGLPQATLKIVDVTLEGHILL